MTYTKRILTLLLGIFILWSSTDEGSLVIGGILLGYGVRK